MGDTDTLMRIAGYLALAGVGPLVVGWPLASAIDEGFWGNLFGSICALGLLLLAAAVAVVLYEAFFVTGAGGGGGGPSDCVDVGQRGGC